MKIIKAETTGIAHTGNLRKNKGITLIALAITIIILLILAGITITQLTGSGIFGKAKIVKQRTRYETAKEIVNLKLMEIQVDCEEKEDDYTINKIAEGMKEAKDITIEKYYNTETSKIKNEIEENLINLEGIVVSVDKYSEYKFLIGEKRKIEGVLEGKVTDTTSKETFMNVEEFEEKTFNSTENNHEEKPNIEVVNISDKEYTFTCIDKNYQGYNLYLCDEVIPYSVCGPYGSTNYANSKLRTWLNDNAPENAIEIILEDKGTTEKMFILSKEEDEKYEECSIITWEASKAMGNMSYWTRTYAGRNGWMYCRSHTGNMSYLDIAWTAWNGCRPAFVLDR